MPFVQGMFNNILNGNQIRNLKQIELTAIKFIHIDHRSNNIDILWPLKNLITSTSHNENYHKVLKLILLVIIFHQSFVVINI